MKVTTYVYCTVWCLFIIFNRMVQSELTETQYLSDVYWGYDRTAYPLDKDQCDDYPYSRLKTCQLLKQDKDELKDISEDNLTYDLHYWKEVTSEDSYAYVPELSSRLYTAFTYKTQFLNTNYLNRKRRSLETSPVPDPAAKSRRKRDVPGNPCSSGISVREVVYEAPDAKNSKVIYELFQNPEENFYQTYFIRRCDYDYFYQFECKIQYVDHLALVYVGSSYEVQTRLIKIPALCAISVG